MDAEPGPAMQSLAGRVLLAVAFLASLVVVAIAASYIVLSAPLPDDLLVADRARHLGWYGYAIEDIYFRFSGRWSDYALLSLVLGHVDPTRHYALLLAALAVCQLVGFYALGRLLWDREMSRAGTWACALALWAVVWAGRPVPQETVYWFSGGVPYQLSVSLSVAFLAFMGGLARWMTRVGARRPPTAAASVALFLAFAIPGLYEMTGLALCLVLGAATGIAYFEGAASRHTWSLVLAVASVGFLVVLFAPGNSSRGGRFEYAADIWITLEYGLRDVANRCPGWILDPKLLATSLVLAIHPYFTRLRPAWARDRVWRIVIPIGWAGLVFGGFAGPHWATGRVVFDRTHDWVYGVFVIGWLASVFVWTRRPLGISPSRSLPARAIESGALIALALSLLLTGNTPIALEGLRNGEAVEWYRATQARDATLRELATRGVEHATVAPLPPWPALIRPLAKFDIRSVATARANRQVAGFYSLSSVVRGRYDEERRALVRRRKAQLNSD